MDIAVQESLHNLTPVQKTFCHYFVSDPMQNQTEAYLKIDPDLTRKSACARGNKLLKNTEVKTFIAHLMDERSKRLEMDEDWVMMRLRDIHDRCMQSTPVWEGVRYGRDDEGESIENEPSYYKFDATGALKALELMGRHMKMFSDKLDGSNLEVGVNINLGGDHKVIEGKFSRVANR